MKKIMTAIAAAGVLALASVTFTSDAQAQRCRGCGVGLGIVGGLAAGAIIGGAIAARPYASPYGYYGYYGYGPYPYAYPASPGPCLFWNGYAWVRRC
jgi:hypothetical protein